MPRGLTSSTLMKPFVVLALPGMYLFYKYNQYRRQQQEQNRRKVTERELAHLNHKISISLWVCVAGLAYLENTPLESDLKLYPSSVVPDFKALMSSKASAPFSQSQMKRNLLNTLCRRAEKTLRRALCNEEHHHPESNHDVRVTVLGAAGKVGHLASLLLKQSPLLAELRLYDVSGVEELGDDVSLINTNCAVRVFSGVEELPDALEGTDIVLFMVGNPGKPPMTSKDLFTLNAELTAALAHQCAALCPDAILGVCTKPVNSVVPLVSEVMKLYGVYNPDKIVGMTTLNTIRANSTVADEYLTNAAYVHVPVIGGASTETAVPLLSRALPFSAFSQDMTEMLVTKIMDREAGHGICSAAHAVSRFIQNLARGLHNHKSVMSAFVRSDTCPGLRYFCNQIRFGPNGVMRNYGIPPLTPFEIQLLYSVRHKVKHEIVAGEKFAREN